MNNHNQNAPAEHPATSAEAYADIFDPFEPNASPPYVPKDGASIRHSVINLYCEGKWNGYMQEIGHATVEDLHNEPFIRSLFAENPAREKIEVGILHCTYDHGVSSRDATEAELTLICMGAFKNERPDDMLPIE